MAIYTFPDGFVARIKAQKAHVVGEFLCDASALIGNASGDPVGFGGDAAIASAFEPDVTGSDAAVVSALKGIVDALQAHGLMGAS